MLEVKLARGTWALGLIVILCTYNLAYANVKVSENSGAQPARVRTNKLNDDGATKKLPTYTTTTTVPSGKKKVSSVKHSATAANSCACSCSATTGRAAATPGAWWDCFKGCLRSWGVSPAQLAMCAAVCGFGGVPLCAICVGVDVSVALLCSIGCSIYGGIIELPEEGFEPILVRQTPRDNRKR